MRTFLFIIICMTLSCKSNPQKQQQMNIINDSLYRYELDKHPGTENYEIVHPTRYGRITHFLFDTIARRIMISNDMDYVLVSPTGSFIDSMEYMGELRSKTYIIKGDNGFSDFLLNGKKNIVPYNVVRISKNKDILKIYDDMYHKAEICAMQEDILPFMKIDGKWLYVTSEDGDVNGFLLSDEGRAKYPEKPITNRFKVIDPFGPQLNVPPDRRDTSVFKIVDYMPAVVEKERWGMSTHTYSAGYYQVEIYMPGGDTIRFRRASAMGVNIDMYRLPKEYGGRQDILFLNLDPPGDANLKDGCSGLYVIRPRDLSAPEKRYAR